MANKKILVAVVLSLTAFNLLIFFNRDNFQYYPYANYKSLYKGGQADPVKWENFNSHYPESEKIETKRITDSLINGQKTTIAKALILGNYLHTRFKKQLGKPSNELSVSSPIIQYKKLCYIANEKLWCSTWAQMFSYFCFSQGIVCRYIEIMQPGDHHVVNECYLPETNEWVLMDLTFNLLLIQNKDGHYLNLASFKNSIKQSATLFALKESGSIYKPDLSITPIQHFYNNDFPLYYYYTLDTKQVYSFGSKLARYFLPMSWYIIYDDQEKSNMLFYSKVILFLLWIVALFVFLMPLKMLKK